MAPRITIKSPDEIGLLRLGGKRLGEILKRLTGEIKPGVSTLDLDILAERLIREQDGVPVFKGYIVKETAIPFPGSVCTSINDEVVHGIPRPDRILRDGDIIGIDIGMRYRGLVTDTAVTVGVGKISADAARLIRATREALDAGIVAVHSGATLGDIGCAVETRLKKDNLGIIRDLAGHGVGYELHEPPMIPNYGKPGTGLELREGMVIAIEPMATLGDWRITLDDDEWTFRTADGSLAAHFEHTIAVTSTGAEVLTLE
ncbi:MAG: methionyl aminopeptidase [Parcubacteria group bacterium Greene0714_36]|nr:MAG: methionyl aminopeptidase [Parcubacteria group bacterium Greene0714_36]